MGFSVPEPHCRVLLIPTLACDRQRPHPVTCQEPLNEEPPSYRHCKFDWSHTGSKCFLMSHRS